MPTRYICLLLALLLLTTSPLYARTKSWNDPLPKQVPAFTIIPLGTLGGCIEQNLSSYLLRCYEEKDMISLDSGSIMSGLLEAEDLGALDDFLPPEDAPWSTAGWVMTKHIKAHLISHPHLDHMAGLIANSPFDSPKALIGTATTLNAIRDHIFNGVIWPNMSNEGKGALNKYHYERLSLGKRFPIANTKFNVTAFELSHYQGYLSTAFLIETQKHAILYLGDTGPDGLEKGDHLDRLWQKVAPLIQKDILRGLMMECSFDDTMPDDGLYGHMSPRWFMRELTRLAKRVDPKAPKRALKGFPVIVVHIKPRPYLKGSAFERVRYELDQSNELGVKLIFPKQGVPIDL